MKNTILFMKNTSLIHEDNQNNRTKYFIFNLRKVDNSNKWKNYVIVTRVKLSVKLDALVVQSIFI